MEKNSPRKIKKIEMPHTYIIIFFVVLFASILTYIVPSGYFQVRETSYEDLSGNVKTRTVPIPGTFQYETNDSGKPVRNGIELFAEGGGIGVTNYAFEGLVSGSKWGSAVGVIAFILIIGGAFGIVMKTGAIEAAIMAVIKKSRKTEILIIPVLFILFSLGGALFGMGEQAMVFIMIIAPLMVALKYDAVTAVMVTYVATQIGFGTSPMNPFSCMIAQGIAGVPILSGALFRWIMWSFFTILGIVYTMIYSRNIRKNPTHSPSYESDAYFREDMEAKKNIAVKLELGHILVLLIFGLTMVWIIWGVITRSYYIPEIATQFFVMGMIAGIIGVIFKLNGMKMNDIARSFMKGSSNLLAPALVVGFAKGIVLVLGGDNPAVPSVLNTVLHHAGKALSDFPTTLSAWSMYLFQSVFNFFVVSGSGQAALTMPIMAPLAEMIGVTKQVAVLAFQLGDGFTNLIVPTSGALIGALAAARIDWLKWVKFQLKFQLILFICASIIIILAVMIGFK